MTVQRDRNGDWRLKADVGSVVFRWALIIAFISQTPILDPLWKQVGMRSLSTQLVDLDNKMTSAAGKVEDLHRDVEQLKQDTKMLNTRITGFEINFQTYVRRQQ